MDKQIGRQSKLLLNGQTDRHAEGYVRRQAGTQGQSGLLKQTKPSRKVAEKISKRN